MGGGAARVTGGAPIRASRARVIGRVLAIDDVLPLEAKILPLEAKS